MIEGGADGCYLANLDLVIDSPRLRANRAEGHDGNFARVQDWGSGVNAEDTDVGDGDGSILHVRRGGLAFAGGSCQLLDCLSEL